MRKKTEWIVLILLAAASAVLIFLSPAGPAQLEIPDSVTREQALQLASAWLNANAGISPASMDTTIELKNDPNMEGYLHLQGLQKQFAQVYQTARSTAFWQVTFYKTGLATRYSLDIDTATGSVVGYGLFPPAPASASRMDSRPRKMTSAAARELALQALQAAGHDRRSMQVKGIVYVSSPSRLLQLLDDETGQYPAGTGAGIGKRGSGAGPTFTVQGPSLPGIGPSGAARGLGSQIFRVYAVTVQDMGWQLVPGKSGLLQYRVLVAADPAVDMQAAPKKVPGSPLPVAPAILGVHQMYGVPASTVTFLDHQRLLAKYLTAIYVLGSLLLAVLGLVVLFRYRRDRVRFSRGWLFMLVSCSLLLVHQLNMWPTYARVLSGISFGSRFATVQTNLLLFAAGSVLEIILAAAALYISVVAGSAMAEDLWPGKWGRRGERGWPQRIWRASLRGYLLALIWLGLEAVFYAVFNQYFGAWEESDAGQSPWNLAVPGLFPLMAWVAGTQEEATYRLLGIALLKRFFPRNTTIALLIPAMIWALGHSLYPVYPFYTRFIELTLFGLLIGYCFLRWDFETVVFAHATYDTIAMSQVLLGGQATSRIWAVFFLLLPLIVGFYAHLWQGRTAGRQHAGS